MPDTLEYFNDECRRFSSHPPKLFDSYDKAYHEGFAAKCDVSYAIKRLSQLDFVLFTERFQQIKNVFQQIFQLKEEVRIPKVKERSNNPGFRDLPKELRELIAAGNADDAAFYARAASMAA